MKIAFFGDSITAGFTQLKKHSQIYNMGIGGNKINNLIGRIEPLLNQTFDQLFMMIGINDILWINDFWGNKVTLDIEKLYDLLITTLKKNMPNTQINCISVLPISVTLSDKKLCDINKQIIHFNAFIKKTCQKNKIHYIDLHRHFYDGKKMIQAYTYDGVHLTQKGYDQYYAIIQPLLRLNEMLVP